MFKWGHSKAQSQYTRTVSSTLLKKKAEINFEALLEEACGFLKKPHQKMGETFLFFPEFSPGIEKVI